jgi:hypothetical protein
LRAAAVMHLHGCVLPGSRLFMPDSRLGRNRVGLGLFPKGGLVRPLCSERAERTRRPDARRRVPREGGDRPSSLCQ